MHQSAARATSRSPLRRAAAALSAMAIVAGSLVVALAPATPAAAIGPVIDCSSDPSILNTGYDGAGGRLTSGIDSGWDWGGGLGGAPSTVPSWADAQIVTTPSGLWTVSPFNNASWISYSSSGSHFVDSYFYFRYQFEIDAAVQTNVFSVSLDFFADNSVQEIWINDVAQSGNLPEIPQATPPSNPFLWLGYRPGDQASTTLNQNWVTGQNEIVVMIQSAANSVGFLAQTTSTGFCADYGDAPGSYGTSIAGGGPAHVLEDYDGTDTPLMIGSSIDPEADGSGFTGLGDDSSGSDDETGVTTFPTLTTLTGSYSLPVAVTNTTGATATLAGWIDLDGSGTFDAGELATVPVPAGATTASVVWSGIQSTAGTSYVRLRLYPGVVASPSPIGQVNGGEVEDYAFTIDDGDLSIEKTSDVTNADEGDEIEYTITVTNNASTAADDVVITDDLVDVLDDAVYVTGSADVGSLVNTAGVLTWTGDLAAGQTATITYKVRVTSTPLGDRQLDNVVIDNSRVGSVTSNCDATSTDPECAASVTASTPFDFGDAPAGYGSASHALFGFDGAAFTSSLSLGALVDSEPAAAPDDGADDDAATFANLVSTASTYSLTVAVRNTTGSAATLAGWIDFNHNGAFDSGERATVSVPAAATTAQLQWTGFTATPSSTFARLRLVPGGVAPGATGGVIGGEVEDYALAIVIPPAAILAFTGAVLPPVGIIAVLLLGLGLPLALRRRNAVSIRGRRPLLNQRS